MKMLYQGDTEDRQTKCLTVAEVPLYLALRDQLPADKQAALKPRTQADLEGHIRAGMPLIGTFENGDLKAAALLTYTSPEFQAHTRYLEDYPLSNDCAVLQGVVSLGGLKHVIARAWDHATQRGCTQLLAKVKDGNIAAMESFERKGFSTIQTITDPAGCTAHFMLATINEAPNAAAPSGCLLPVQDLPESQSPTVMPQPAN